MFGIIVTSCRTVEFIRHALVELISKSLSFHSFQAFEIKICVNYLLWNTSSYLGHQKLLLASRRQNHLINKNPFLKGGLNHVMNHTILLLSEISISSLRKIFRGRFHFSCYVEQSMKKLAKWRLMVLKFTKRWNQIEPNSFQRDENLRIESTMDNFRFCHEGCSLHHYWSTNNTRSISKISIDQ